MAKGDRGKRTRSDILQTAVRLFSLQGYFHTSTSDILEAVSISKGAFYHHFKSKEDLALAVLAQLRDDYNQMLIDPVRAVDSSRRVEEMLRRIIELNQSGQWSNCLLLAHLAQEMTQQESDLSEQVAKTVNWLIGFWQEIISDAQAAGSIDRKLDSRTLAELIFSALLGAVTCRELDEASIDLAKIAQQIKLLIG